MVVCVFFFFCIIVALLASDNLFFNILNKWYFIVYCLCLSSLFRLHGEIFKAKKNPCLHFTKVMLVLLVDVLLIIHIQDLLFFSHLSTR